MKTYEFRLYPTKCQRQRLEDYLDASCSIYNWALEDRQNHYRYAKCSTGFYDQSKFLVEMRKKSTYLTDIHVHALQTTLKRVDLAFQSFFRRVKNGEKPGYPRFKGRYRFDSFSFKENGNGFTLERKRLKLSKIGRVRIRKHREIDGEIKTCIIKKRADGWYVLFCVETEPAKPNSIVNPIGVDVGLNSFAVLSNGEKIKNHRFLKKGLEEIKRKQRLLSRKKKRSNRSKKARRVLAKKHLKVQRQRKDFHCKVASDLVRRFNPIFVEKLNILQLIKKATEDKKNHKKIAAKSENILDVGWGLFLQRLGGKAESAGSVTKTVEPRGTSQECSGCKMIVKKGLDERIHCCPDCGLVLDRDENAAKNILQRGLLVLEEEWTVPSGREKVGELLPMNREATPL